MTPRSPCVAGAPIPTLHDLEAAAFTAWPALEQVRQHGWLLRSAQGYTKRANSANALPGATRLDAAQLADIEAFFKARQLPTIFRLASFALPAGVDEVLADRGYRWVDPSWVMVRELRPDAAHPAPAPPTPWPVSAADWLAGFQAISGKLGADQALHLQLLQAITAPCAWALHWDGDTPVGCGLAVLVDGRLGLFDIATAASRRGQGLASDLCRQLLDWGRRGGAHTAFLQVTASNTGAIRLYERLGFRPAYRYGYRVAP